MCCKGFQDVRGVTTGCKGLHEETIDYKRLQGVTRGYWRYKRRLEEVKRNYKRLQDFTSGCRRLQGITRG